MSVFQGPYIFQDPYVFQNLFIFQDPYMNSEAELKGKDFSIPFFYPYQAQKLIYSIPSERE